jgi:hypothetical protein
MNKHKAKRIDAGWYEYCGHRIQDHGAGSSVHAAMNRGSSRWHIRKIKGPGAFDNEYVGGAWTFRDAKKRVDQLLAKG